MSWGYFLDLELTLPTADWDALQRTTAADLPKQWWGFAEADLEDTFGNAGFESAMFHKVFGFWTHGESCVKTVVEADNQTSVHLISHLDKGGDTQVAGTLAAMFEAASKVGGTGRIRLVNDGSYSGEDGVEVTIVDGRLVRSRIEGSNEIAEELGLAVYPEFANELELARAPDTKPTTRKSATRKPAAKQPGAKQPGAKQPGAKQPGAKQPAAKQPGAKQPAAKQPVAKQPVAKQPAAKQPAAKQPVAKQPVAKQPVAKQPVAKQPVAKQPVAKTKPVARKSSTKKPATKAKTAAVKGKKRR